MYDDGSRSDGGRGDAPETIFRALKNRPTDEVDGDALWRRIEGDLEPHGMRQAGWFRRIAELVGLNEAPAMPQLAAAGAVVVLMLGLVWWAPAILGPTGPVDAVAPTDGAASPVPGEGAVAEVATAWHLEVRLVRGYDGAEPADAIVSAGAGAGGADRLLDLRGPLAGLPFEDFALVGQWQGAMQLNETTAALSDAFELTFDAEETVEGIALANVMLSGAGRPLLADELTLAPGQPYLLGVQASGETDDVGSLVLAVRLVPADPENPDGRP
ncbi:MAG: hypothetical protein GKS06_04270 [Acidobacteria bacterium]|nr:hypothetical protein [Acidobacteriota bacterium]